MVERYDPLFNRNKKWKICANAGNQEPRNNILTSANEAPPSSPIDKSPMVLAKVRNGRREMKVWLDSNNRICLPVRA